MNKITGYELLIMEEKMQRAKVSMLTFEDLSSAFYDFGHPPFCSSLETLGTKNASCCPRQHGPFELPEGRECFGGGSHQGRGS